MNNILKNKTIFISAAIAVLTLGFSGAFAATKACASSYNYGSLYNKPCVLTGNVTIKGVPLSNPGQNLTLKFNLSGGKGTVVFYGQNATQSDPTAGFAFTSPGNCTTSGASTLICSSPGQISFNYAVNPKFKKYNIMIQNQSGNPITVERHN